MYENEIDMWCTPKERCVCNTATHIIFGIITSINSIVLLLHLYIKMI